MSPLLDRLRTINLDEPPTTTATAMAKGYAKTFIKAKVAPAVLGALFSAAKNAAKSVPFGHVAVAMCEDALSRIQTLRENREAADHLQMVGAQGRQGN